MYFENTAILMEPLVFWIVFRLASLLNKSLDFS